MSPLRVMIGREFNARIAKKGFWVFTVISLVIMIGLTFMTTIEHEIEHRFSTKVVFNDPSRLIGQQLATMVNAHPNQYSFHASLTSTSSVTGFTPAEMSSFMKQQDTHIVVDVQSGSNREPAFVIEENGSTDPSTVSSIETLIQTQVYGMRVASLPVSTQKQLTANVQIKTRQWQHAAKSSGQFMQEKMLVYFMVILLFVTLTMYGAWVAQGVVEEKTNRIVEMLLTTMKPWHILFGKVLGIGLVGLVQYAVLLAGVGGSLVLQHQTSAISLNGISPWAIVAFPIFYVLGYLIFATLFGLAGSLVNRPEEQQMAITPVTMLMLIVFYASIFSLFNPSSTFTVVLSFIPVATPMAMFARIALSSPPLWQVLVSIVLTLLATALLVWFGARVYRRFALRNSGKAGWGVLFRRESTSAASTKL